MKCTHCTCVAQWCSCRIILLQQISFWTFHFPYQIYCSTFSRTWFHIVPMNVFFNQHVETSTADFNKTLSDCTNNCKLGILSVEPKLSRHLKKVHNKIDKEHNLLWSCKHSKLCESVLNTIIWPLTKWLENVEITKVEHGKVINTWEKQLSSESQVQSNISLTVWVWFLFFR